MKYHALKQRTNSRHSQDLDHKKSVTLSLVNKVALLVTICFITIHNTQRNGQSFISPLHPHPSVSAAHLPCTNSLGSYGMMIAFLFNLHYPS